MLDFNKVPNPAMAGGLRRYVEDRIPPGDFLLALLRNDLMGAFRCADQNNLDCMHEWAAWFHNEMPSRSYKMLWGSEEIVSSHLKGETSNDVID